MSKVDLELETQVNEIYAKTTVTQKFSNSEDKPLELKIYLDKVPNLVFNSFQAKIGDSIKVNSKVIKKEKATVKYTDAISSGNAAIFVAETDTNIIINMGNIPPKEEVVFISDFIYFIKHTDHYEFEIFRNLPIFMGKGDEGYKNNKLKEKIYIKTKNKICTFHKDINTTGLKIIKEKYLNYDKKEYFIHYEIEKLPKNYSKDTNTSKFYFDTIYTEPKVFLQKSKQHNEDNYIIQYKCKHKKLEELSPALFIFLIDQSDSMWGDRIKISEKAMELFLKSLPVKFYYQFIGLSSYFVKYDETPKEYTQENFQESIKTIKNLNTDLDDTNILSPFSNKFTNKTYNDIFLLTDVYIEDKEIILNSIKDNNSKFSIFTIGIGHKFDDDLIKKLGLFSKGGYIYCNNISELNSFLIEEIERKKRISGLKLNCSLDNENCIKQTEKPDLIKINDIINFHYITPRKNIDKINFEIIINSSESKEEIKEKFEIKPIEFPEGEEFSKLLIKNDLKYYSEELNNDKALKYQILAENTTLFAEIELSNQITEEMKLKILGDEKNNVIEIYKPNRSSSTNIGMSYSPINNNFMGNNFFMNSMSVNNPMMNMNIPMSMGMNSPMMMGMNSPMMMGMNMGMSSPMMGMSMDNPMMMGMSNPMMSMNNMNQLNMNIHMMNMMNENMSNIKDIINNNNNSYLKEEKEKKQEREYEEESRAKNRELEEKKLKEKEKIMKMIKTQDYIEGFWDVNNLTKFIFEKYKKEYDSLKQKNINDKVAMTILVINYLKDEHFDLLNELLLIIKKAEAYIKKEINCSYEEIIEKIK